MEIILLRDYENIGYKGDIVQVKPGYARNYLLPNGIALPATPSNKKQILEEQRQAARKLEALKKDAEDQAKQLEQLVITLQAKTGTSGKIFGSVTTNQISQALKKEGFDYDRKKISLMEPIKTLGTYKAQIKVYKDVEAEITLEVQGVQQEIGKKDEES